MTNIEHFCAFLTNLSPGRIEKMENLYAHKVDFKDPLNAALDLDHLKKIESDLFKQLKDIRFEITSQSGSDTEGYISWIMKYRFRFWQREIEGVSHIKFNDDSKIIYQHDYWDASFPIYGEFPPLGLIMKGIKKILIVKK